ncbi:RICIN domain-containing protein [Streptomyces sp. NBC_01198]|uniref:RICIN domain-containing protein n=1 Tax=Streptomyces sp. NBC_01198 TaxID=2903769 RepID=UPI002E11A20E|nr:RICIN domain-containing protein [Streptomyces sp. NBC_01198]
MLLPICALPAGRGSWRLLRAAGLILGLLGTLLGSGTAHAASGLAPIDASHFTLTPDVDYGPQIAGLSANSGLTYQDLSTLAGTGAAGKSGLCFPTPFNPGVDADGYCWNNPTDDGGRDSWAPQGISVPHDAAGDGSWRGNRWQVVSWHGGESDSLSKLRFVDRGSSTPRYVDVLMVTAGSGGSVIPRGSHADSVVWYGDNLLVGAGGRLDVYQLGDLRRAKGGLQGYAYVLPVRYVYRTTSASGAACNSVTGTAPCLNGMSFDRANSALTTNEYVQADAAGGRLIRWPFDPETGLPRAGNGSSFGTVPASAAWTSPVWHMQGVVYAQGSFFISGACPSRYHTGYRESSCVHKGPPGGATSVLTAAPDMTQNLDWDASTQRVQGVNEVDQSTQKYPQRLVFDFAPNARAITTVRLKNVNSGKCLMPSGSALDNGATVVQQTCDGSSAESWYWNGSEIRDFQSDRCLTVYGGKTAAGTTMVQWDCNKSSAQQWTRGPDGAGGGSMLVDTNAHMCLTIDGARTDDNAPATQWPCLSASTAHYWTGSS